MRTPRWPALIAFGLLISLTFALTGRSQQESATAAEWNRSVDRAIAYLRKTQRDDGSWSDNVSPGITGIIVTGLLHTGRISADDPMVDHALKYIESLANPEAGHIAGKNPRVQLQNYVTSVNVMALVAAHRENKYRKIIGDATAFLKKLQWDEGEGKNPKSDFYGGFGYDSHSRPDLSNSQFALAALHDAGIPKDDPALQKALIFVSRCQNFKSEYNDQPWAGKINDGSFIYSAANHGQTKIKQSEPALGLPGYGSMTYAGI
ncbi:MAG TPA: prenyltransferase/squalene oxidase repeat-containing protein, partial [Gemmataceae bacterium]|nr:prenyltransferase/squalene oxidase repeat-containing protein [Gemmataceae bacterium]